MAEIRYPTWKVRGIPTPHDTLWVCDHCGHSDWGVDCSIKYSGYCFNCEGRKGGRRRLRKATAAETQIAKTKLINIIGE